MSKLALPSGWERISLSAIGDWRSGGTPSKSRTEYWDGTVPWVSPKDMKIFSLHDTQDHISERAIADGARYAPSGAVFIVVRGMILAHTFPVSLAERPMAFNQDVKAIVTNLATDCRFVAHWMVGQSDALLRIVSEATHGTKRIELRDLLSHEMLRPPPREQQKIAEVLDTLDEAIRKTEAIVAKLKQVKQGMLHDLLKLGIDENGELRDPERHPEQFKDSSLGRIPKTWAATPLRELAEVDRGKFTHRPRNDPDYYGGKYPFIQTGDVAAAETGTLFNASQSLSPRGVKVSREFPAGTIAITIAANIADTAILGIPMYFPDSVVGAVVREPNVVRFVQLCVQRAKPGLEARAPQSAQRNINLQDLRPLLVPCPPPSEQARIADVADAASLRLTQEELEGEKLRVVRQGLMEDLLTGRVRVTGLLAESTP